MNRKNAAVDTVAPPMIAHDTPMPPPWNRMSEPRIIEVTPPAASTPWLTTLISAMKNTIASAMSAKPA